MNKITQFHLTTGLFLKSNLQDLNSQISFCLSLSVYFTYPAFYESLESLLNHKHIWVI